MQVNSELFDDERRKTNESLEPFGRGELDIKPVPDCNRRLCPLIGIGECILLSSGKPHVGEDGGGVEIGELWSQPWESLECEPEGVSEEALVELRRAQSIYDCVHPKGIGVNDEAQDGKRERIVLAIDRDGDGKCMVQQSLKQAERVLGALTYDYLVDSGQIRHAVAQDVAQVQSNLSEHEVVE